MAEMNKERTRRHTDYRLTVVRAADEGPQVKVLEFRSLKTAQRRIRILTSPEPWREWAPEKEPDDRVCCSGHECSCRGLTVAEETAERRKDLPPIESIKLEARTVVTTRAAWTEVTLGG